MLNSNCNIHITPRLYTIVYCRLIRLLLYASGANNTPPPQSTCFAYTMTDTRFLNGSVYIARRPHISNNQICLIASHLRTLAGPRAARHACNTRIRLYSETERHPGAHPSPTRWADTVVALSTTPFATKVRGAGV